MGFIFGFTLSLIVFIYIFFKISSSKLVADLNLRLLAPVVIYIIPIALTILISIALGLGSAIMFLRIIKKQQQSNKHPKINPYIVLFILFLLPVLYLGWVLIPYLEEYANVVSHSYKVTASDCAIVENLMLKEECYINSVIRSKDSTACDKIQTIETKDTCYNYAAEFLLDTSYCDEISDSYYYKYKCYSDVSIKTKNISICENDYIKNNSTHSDNCYIEYATFFDEPEFCEIIKDPNTKKRCIEGSKLSI